jgi:tetratricopeptide (TPR) repeat protein
MFLSNSSDFVQRMATLGREFENMGHFRWAEWIFKRVVHADPPSATALFILGRIQTKRGSLEEGKKTYAKCLALKPDFYQCRVSYFETCREQYWTNLLRTARQSKSRTGNEPPDTNPLALLHKQLAIAIFPQMWFEIGRLDSDDPDVSAFDRLLAMEAKMKGRAAKKFSIRMNSSLHILEEVASIIAETRARLIETNTRSARITRRNGPSISLEGLRDSDDTIANHLEAIIDGQLTFLPMEHLRRIRFGQFGNFTETSVELRDGQKLDIVVPATYYGSRYSSASELKRGDFSVFKDLFDGVQIGVGRRVFQGRQTEKGTSEVFR